MEKHLKDNQKILDMIRSGKSGRDSVLRQLYFNQALKKQVIGLVINKGGNEEIAQSIFSNTLIQFVKTVVKKKDLIIHGELKTYISGIAKYLWYAELNDQKKHRSEEFETHHAGIDAVEPESLTILLEKKHLLAEVLTLMGEKCKNVLMYWANGYRMVKIAEMMGYKSEGMAKKKKYQCMKQLLLYVNENPGIKEALR